MAKSERADYVFEVKDGHVDESGAYVGQEEAWIYCQPAKSELSIVGKGFLSMHLRPGTPHEKVRELARLLRDLQVSIGYTLPR